MTKKRLVTEADVRAAAGAGELLIPAGTIVTPAAKDAAEQLGVKLTTGQRGTGAVTTGQRGRGAEGQADGSYPAPLPLSPSAPPSVVIGADHGGFPMKEALKPLLEKLGFQVLDVGTSSTEAVDYPDFAEAVARAVADGRAARGIMVDGAGIGSAMVANKVPGVRAALCYDLTTASNAREHNDANVLTLGGTLIGQRLAADIVKAFLTTDFGGGRHQARVDKINRLD